MPARFTPRPAVAQMAALVGDVLDKRLGSSFNASARAYSLTMALLDELVPQTEQSDQPAYITKVIAFCRAHLAEHGMYRPEFEGD